MIENVESVSEMLSKIDTNLPVAKYDESGNLISNFDEMKNLYVRVYKHRLRHRDIKPGFEQLRELKENLFKMRKTVAMGRKTDQWSTSEVVNVLKLLKVNKATDPVGHVNEIFKPGVAGVDLVQSLVTLCNMMKEECQLPAFLELANITSIYKRKGSKLDLNNDRGIFTVTCLRTILDKLLYNDFYDEIDSNLSDSNVGGRKKRNIRDNLFIVYGIINNAIQNNLEVDMNLYDVAKCFDAQWHAETMNDMWNVGVNNDKFALMSKLNEKCNIGIKTPAGMTERFRLEEIEMQGTVAGPIKATVQIDSLGRDCYERREGLYLYNDCVSVPPLSMCDDVASFALCGVQSVMTNAIINAMIESKKLEFGPTKCYNLHVGKSETFCQDLKVHGESMSKRQFETYLGDIVSVDAKNDHNLEKRKNNGIGAISQIMSTVKQVTLGHYHFEVTLIMRDSILISKMIYSSEIWYNLTKHQFTKLEKIDEMFMRRILDLPSSAPRIS